MEYLTIYDVLEEFRKNCYKSAVVDLFDLFDSYEYFANIMSAYMINENGISNDKYEHYNALHKGEIRKPTLGYVIIRFGKIYDDDKVVKNKILETEIPILKAFLEESLRLFENLAKNSFDFSTDIELKILNTDKTDDIPKIIVTLLKIVLALRNEITHNRVRIEIDTFSILKYLYEKLILLTKNLVLGKSTDFLKTEKDIVKCLNYYDSENFYYRNMSYKTEFTENKTKIESLVKILSADRKIIPQDIKNRDFISIPKGGINFSSYNSDGSADIFVDSFYISKYPVTNQEFLLFLDNNKDYYQKRKDYFKKRKEPKEIMKHYFNPEKIVKDNAIYKKERYQKEIADHAVFYVDWVDAVMYCNYLSLQNGLEPVYCEEDYSWDLRKNGFRLPSEAEWYYAVSCGGEETIDENSLICISNQGKYGQTVSNKDLVANKWGICGMLGNIHEFTNDNSKKAGKKKSEVNFDKSVPRKIIKGGSFKSRKEMITFDWATDVPYIDNPHYIGFRVVIKDLPSTLQKKQALIS
ncbi:MAG: formylglycine-generating enzyme family protein [Oscillospiraceae bacterium]|jgi:formylglycine-generating enzyme required for sulfatase activity|nr:formylglycine-generating enzyme family protein [Oscillospiraceae bacterium]